MRRVDHGRVVIVEKALRLGLQLPDHLEFRPADDGMPAEKAVLAQAVDIFLARQQGEIELGAARIEAALAITGTVACVNDPEVGEAVALAQLKGMALGRDQGVQGAKEIEILLQRVTLSLQGPAGDDPCR